MTYLHMLHQLGQSTWLNYLRNNYIRSGDLAGDIDQGIQGITTNMLAYQQAIAAGGDYDDAIRREITAGTPLKSIHEALVNDDIQRAADLLHPIFEASNGLDGFVNLELDPALMHDSIATTAEVRRLTYHIDRYNIMVEIPSTKAGIEAIRNLIADGISINATHIFSVATYERVAQAYIEGLEQYHTTHSVWRRNPTAVASFSLAPIDAAADAFLEKAGRPDLAGKTAIAIAKVLYNRFRKIFSGPRWGQLAAKGGRVLRPKWSRTQPANFLLSDTHYINALIGPDTIITFSTNTLRAFLDLGQPEPTLTHGLDEATTHLTNIGHLGLDLEALSEELQAAHFRSSDRLFQNLIQTIMKRRDELEQDWHTIESNLGQYNDTVRTGLNDLCTRRIVSRIWAHDHTVWKPEPKEITNRLGWLHIMTGMRANLGRLGQTARDLRQDGFTHALLLGMGGSSLAPELFQKTLGRPARSPHLPFSELDLVILDTTDADAVRNIEQSLDLTKTIFIVATKSGGTVETLSGYKYFYNRLSELVGAERAGQQFIGITDPGSKIVELAQQYGFRDLFLNDPDIGGRYSALSFFGLVPAAMVGANVDTLLEQAEIMAANARLCGCDSIDQNMAAHLGTIIGRLALEGRDKVTFITSPALASFGDWAEQLIAESLGKEGKGVLPVVGEPIALPEMYGQDRLFIHLKLANDYSHDIEVAALTAAGHPVVTVRLQDMYDLGGQFLLWELATAIAGYFLQINPFDQPNVEAAKIKAREVVADYAATGRLSGDEMAQPEANALVDFINKAQPHDYIAIQAYTPTTPAMDAALANLRAKIRTMITARLGHDLATTTGYGPRFLHSTGQLHKGDRGNGLFIQFVSEAEKDVAIPNEAGQSDSAMGFNVLKKAQALGDGRALREAHRRLIAFKLGSQPAAEIDQLAKAL